MNLESYIDHTLLSPDATISDIKNICEEAIINNFFSVCVAPAHVSYAAKVLNNESPKLCTTIGFPLGAIPPEMKYAEARFLIHQGAEELDMVINIGAIKIRDLNILKKEIRNVVRAANGNIVKVIIETCLLTNDEKVLISNIIQDEGAHFVKTSTGFSLSGANIEDIILLRKTLDPHVKIKASGGIKRLSDVKKYIEYGANRIGTSSGISIMEEQKNE